MEFRQRGEKLCTRKKPLLWSGIIPSCRPILYNLWCEWLGTFHFRSNRHPDSVTKRGLAERATLISYVTRDRSLHELIRRLVIVQAGPARRTDGRTASRATDSFAKRIHFTLVWVETISRRLCTVYGELLNVGNSQSLVEHSLMVYTA